MKKQLIALIIAGSVVFSGIALGAPRAAAGGVDTILTQTEQQEKIAAVHAELRAAIVQAIALLKQEAIALIEMRIRELQEEVDRMVRARAA